MFWAILGYLGSGHLGGGGYLSVIQILASATAEQSSLQLKKY